MLTHFDAAGQAHMVDIADKGITRRIAIAGGSIRMLPATLARIREGSAAKGDVLGIARIAAIQGAKRTADLIPLCHPLALDHASAEVVLDERAGTATITVTVRMDGRTGVEMEALTAASVGALAIYDMVKGIEGPAPRIADVVLLEKTVGGEQRDRGAVDHPATRDEEA